MPGATFWVGKQEAAGGQFNAYWDKVGAIGHYDYGVLTMARTLGSDPNQVRRHFTRESHGDYNWAHMLLF